MAGCALQDAEPQPRTMPDEIAHEFGYGLYSGRYGNIYTARQMAELLTEIADGDPDPALVWENRGRYRDALRPTVEPSGLGTIDEVLFHRGYHLARLSQMLQQTDVFIFTLGLTEAWQDRPTGRTLPLCPGVAGGKFDAGRHNLHVFTHREVLADLATIYQTLRRFNPAMELILTVSPVPLTATATGNHVMLASTHAKATLRSAVGDFVTATPGTDYIPSYEVITQAGCGGPWFAPNLREVSPKGVERVMDMVLTAHDLLPPDDATHSRPSDDGEDDAHCDEILLESFAQ